MPCLFFDRVLCVGRRAETPLDAFNRDVLLRNVDFFAVGAFLGFAVCFVLTASAFVFLRRLVFEPRGDRVAARCDADADFFTVFLGTVLIVFFAAALRAGVGNFFGATALTVRFVGILLVDIRAVCGAAILRFRADACVLEFTVFLGTVLTAFLAVALRAGVVDFFGAVALAVRRVGSLVVVVRVLRVFVDLRLRFGGVTAALSWAGKSADAESKASSRVRMALLG